MSAVQDLPIRETFIGGDDIDELEAVVDEAFADIETTDGTVVTEVRESVETVDRKTRKYSVEINADLPEKKTVTTYVEIVNVTPTSPARKEELFLERRELSLENGEGSRKSYSSQEHYVSQRKVSIAEAYTTSTSGVALFHDLEEEGPTLTLNSSLNTDGNNEERTGIIKGSAAEVDIYQTIDKEGEKYETTALEERNGEHFVEKSKILDTIGETAEGSEENNNVIKAYSTQAEDLKVKYLEEEGKDDSNDTNEDDEIFITSTVKKKRQSNARVKLSFENNEYKEHTSKSEVVMTTVNGGSGPQALSDWSKQSKQESYQMNESSIRSSNKNVNKEDMKAASLCENSLEKPGENSKQTKKLIFTSADHKEVSHEYYKQSVIKVEQTVKFEGRNVQEVSVRNFDIAGSEDITKDDKRMEGIKGEEKSQTDFDKMAEEKTEGMISTENKDDVERKSDEQVKEDSTDNAKDTSSDIGGNMFETENQAGKEVKMSEGKVVSSVEIEGHNNAEAATFEDTSDVDYDIKYKNKGKDPISKGDITVKDDTCTKHDSSAKDDGKTIEHSKETVHITELNEKDRKKNEKAKIKADKKAEKKSSKSKSPEKNKHGISKGKVNTEVKTTESLMGDSKQVLSPSEKKQVSFDQGENQPEAENAKLESTSNVEKSNEGKGKKEASISDKTIKLEDIGETGKTTGKKDVKDRKKQDKAKSKADKKAEKKNAKSIKMQEKSETLELNETTEEDEPQSPKQSSLTSPKSPKKVEIQSTSRMISVSTLEASERTSTLDGSETKQTPRRPEKLAVRPFYRSLSGLTVKEVMAFSPTRRVARAKSVSSGNVSSERSDASVDDYNNNNQKLLHKAMSIYGGLERTKLSADMSTGIGVCCRCGEGFGTHQQIVNSNGEVWHPQCFVCAQCFQPFPEGIFYEYEGRKYCEHDFHVLFAPCCGKCGEFIVGRVIKALNNSWHPDCFRCQICAGPLADSGFVKNAGRALCRECNAREKARGLGKYVCHKCHSIIEEGHIKYKGEAFHPYHFNCNSCSIELNADAREVNGELYCLRCHDKMGIPICGACRRPIEERVVHALGKAWHVEHFVCAKCEKPFFGTRHYEKKGLAYCEIHYHQLFGNICFTCNSVISGDVFHAFNKAWHVNHFGCSICERKMSQKTKFFEFDLKPVCKFCYEKFPSELKRRLKKQYEEQSKK